MDHEIQRAISAKLQFMTACTVAVDYFNKIPVSRFVAIHVNTLNIVIKINEETKCTPSYYVGSGN